MLNLDSADELREGFRLQYLEVYNWGTFNHKVWSVEPDGSTALLTGANGSGKSTLVDALLTLLVPNRHRNYNQASGAEKRRERDEKSYVRGAYGRLKDEESSRGVTQYLRGKDEYSVLLACFASEQLLQDVTLAQVFFWKADELDKIHIVAPRRLHIAEDLRITSTPDELRKRLKAAGANVYEDFAPYSRHAIKLFRLRSEKALDLFNQTVSIKEIGGLNDFVRQHMLEKTDVGERITQLRETYQNLTSAHDAIAKAEEQLARLTPLLQEADQYMQIQARITEAERCAEIVPAFFARRKLDLLARATARAQSDLAEQDSRASALEAHKEALRRQEIDLNVAISNDTAGQQLQQLRRETEHVRERRREKKLRADKYSATARSLGLPPYSEQESFFETARQARGALAPIEKRLQAIVVERDGYKQEEGRLRGVCQSIERELESLRQRKSRIPSDDLVIRTRLAQALKIAEDDLPFVGELLKVRDEARGWEGAIERLLRGYGRQMLVPEEHYRRVIGYVEGTNLRGRLVFLRADPRRTPRASTADRDALVGKLEIKPDAALHDWLKADLIEHWDYVCCATIEQFQRERRALTINGQIKSGGARHEKDDRFDLSDRTRYVLGWDNRDTIAALEAEYARQSAALKTTQAAIKALEEEQKKRVEQQRLLHELLTYDDFAAIDWQIDERQLREL
ncbi:MAG TPA: ATP-binding protein, partial [Roseiflexaceae bacterium]|nr:ATP-binding protein [Roseiflexaceae bacterium]